MKKYFGLLASGLVWATAVIGAPAMAGDVRSFEFDHVGFVDGSTVYDAEDNEAGFVEDNKIYDVDRTEVGYLTAVDVELGYYQIYDADQNLVGESYSNYLTNLDGEEVGHFIGETDGDRAGAALLFFFYE